MASQIFLAHQGKISGPFDQKQLDEMKANGQIQNYFWIWEGQEWLPANPPPPKPVVAPPKNVENLLVICHDLRSVLSGRLVQLTAQGATFVCEGVPDSAKNFKKLGSVSISILNEKSRKTENLKSILESSQVDDDGNWAMKLRWENAPPSLS